MGTNILQRGCRMALLPFYLFTVLLFASCDDYLTIYPEDDIVDDEYWRNGDQVQSVVASCYRYMCDNNVLRKMALWGEIRSDNVDYSAGSSEEEEMHDADMYLWKASDINNADAAGDYQKCIDYCDDILGDENSTLVFSEWQDMYNDVFYEDNATESIFELNFRTNGLANTSTSTLYGNTSKGSTAHFNPTTNLYNQFGDDDARRYQYLQLNYVSSSGTPTVSSYKIFKYEGMRPASDFGSSDYGYRGTSSYANWIVYRLADVYLMKAEALAQIAKESNNEAMAEQAVHLCNVLYTRANQDLDSLSITQVSDAEDIVLEERRRELCFEGKRWYDLLRKVRREGSTEKALNLLVGARSDETTLFSARLSTVDAWYLPVSKTEMNANPNLHQNAYYSLTEQ